MRPWRGLAAVLAAFILLLPTLPAAAEEADYDFSAAVDALRVKSYADKEVAISALADTGNDRSIEVLEGLLVGRLFYRKSDQRMVLAEPQDVDYEIRDAATGEPLGTTGKRKLKKIGINNKLRKHLRGTIARLNLAHNDPAVRMAAVKEMMRNLDAAASDLLRAAMARERDVKVREAIRSGIALADLDSPDAAIRLRAVTDLTGSLLPEARNRLSGLAERNADGSSSGPDETVSLAARKALQSIESKLALNRLAETVFFGLSLGSVLLLAAIGLAITFGVMGVINMAHGELIMLGAYTTYLVQLAMPNHLDYSLFVAIPAAFLVAGLFGIAIEQGVIRYLYGRPLETLLATFGISLILQQLVRTTISAQNVAVSNPSWMSGSMEINPALAITYNRLYILIFALLVFAALLAVLKRTSLGLQVRAVSQNRAMAKAMGIRSEWVDAMTFGLGSGIAGVAGVALSQLTNVGPNMGQSYIIDSFMVVVFGGVANLWGTLVGAMSLGVANKFLEPFAGAVLAKILVLVFIILFIQKRPRGLFPQKGRAAEG